MAGFRVQFPVWSKKIKGSEKKLEEKEKELNKPTLSTILFRALKLKYDLKSVGVFVYSIFRI